MYILFSIGDINRKRGEADGVHSFCWNESATTSCGSEKAADFARSQFKRSFKDIDRLLRAFQNGEIESRQFVQPIEWYQTHHSFEEKNNLYLEKALAHAKEAVIHCLHEKAFLKKPIRFEEIDALFFISSTGLSTPSLDAKLMNVLPFSPYTKRVPIWGLGCGAERRGCPGLTNT